MNSIEQLEDSVRSGRGYVALAPGAAFDSGVYAVRGMRTGQRAVCRSALDLAVRLELESAPGLRSITDMTSAAAGWGRPTGSASDEAPYLVATMVVGGRMMAQVINVCHCGDVVAEARAAKVQRLCADLRIPHGIVTDELRDWARAGTLLWIAGCLERGAPLQARAAILDALDAEGWRRPLGVAVRQAARRLDGDIRQALDALGCMIFERQFQVDLDAGPLWLDEPLAARRCVERDRTPSALVEAWKAPRPPARILAA